MQIEEPPIKEVIQLPEPKLRFIAKALSLQLLTVTPEVLLTKEAIQPGLRITLHLLPEVLLPAIPIPIPIAVVVAAAVIEAVQAAGQLIEDK